MKNKNIMLVFICLLFSSEYNFGQINLGTASSFVMFTSAGAFDNIGASEFIGDIGTNVGDITGFPLGTVSGQIHQENPTTAQAAADVESAYNDLTAVVCDSTLNNALGSAQVLKPYTYCILSAASLTGELTFDADNDPNAIFIIKVNGLIDIVSLSEIILVNAANASNIFWQIDGAVNVGDSAVVKGTFIANGALSFAEGSDIVGRGLSRVGAITTVKMDASLPGSALPITLIDFNVENKSTHNFISWSTESETDNDYFTVEHTFDGINYTNLATINGAGTSNSTINYTHSDFNFERKINYYRLTQTDYNGESESFNVISINNLKESKEIVKILNTMGQEINVDYIGLRIIYFGNGDVLKINGRYVSD